jgi:hypothetical protein
MLTILSTSFEPGTLAMVAKPLSVNMYLELPLPHSKYHKQCSCEFIAVRNACLRTICNQEMLRDRKVCQCAKLNPSVTL